jgi:hypothetical protein
VLPEQATAGALDGALKDEPGLPAAGLIVLTVQEAAPSPETPESVNTLPRAEVPDHGGLASGMRPANQSSVRFGSD